jgi:16S rRNA (cytosine967-C5)-methyltransferase
LATFHAGHFYVQNEAAQLAAYLLDPQPGERILDACAAPGGKSTLLAELTEGRAEVVALDRSEKGVQRIRENVERLGARSVTAVAGDLMHDFAGSNRLFDRVLLDAPCSAWGVLREHPEWRWHKDTHDLPTHAEHQAAMLRRAFELIKEGGVVVYSVCTFSPEETVEQVKQGRLEDPTPHLPPGLVRFVRNSYVQTYPGDDDLDGFFCARFRT